MMGMTMVTRLCAIRPPMLRALTNQYRLRSWSSGYRYIPRRAVAGRRPTPPRHANNNRRPAPANDNNKILLPPPPHLQEILQQLEKLDNQYTFRGRHVVRYVLILGTSIAALAVLFREDIIRFLSGQGSEVARQTMQDRALQQEVDRITLETTNTLLSDPQTVHVTLEFLLRVLQRDETRAQVVTLLSKVITDPTSVQALSRLLRDPVTIKQLQQSLSMLLEDPSVRKSLNEMVFNLLQDAETQRLLEGLVMDILKRDSIQRATADFFSDVIRTQPVIDATNESVQKVIEDLSRNTKVHEQLATAGSSSIKRMVIPRFLFKGGNGPNHANDEEQCDRFKTNDVIKHDEIDLADFVVAEEEAEVALVEETAEAMKYQRAQ